MKGQFNIEFLAAAGLFLIAMIGVITGQVLPSYSSGERMTLNLEAKTLTDQLLREEGRHSYGTGSENWEKNDSTIESVSAVGFADGYHTVDRQKLEALKTVTLDGSTALNYSSFREITGVRNQFRFDFIWLPTVQTNKSFTKSRPPGSEPGDVDITEPDTPEYSLADNNIHYGTVTLQGIKYNFLVTSHDEVYDSVYVSEDNWDFSDSNPSEPYEVGDEITENDFQVESFQNRNNDRGALVIIRKEIKEFGPSINTDTEVITLDRYAVLEGEPLRMEVAAW